MRLIKNNNFVEVADFKTQRIAEFKKQGWVEFKETPIVVVEAISEVEIKIVETAVKPNNTVKRGHKTASI